MIGIILFLLFLNHGVPAAQNNKVSPNPFPKLTGPFRVGACDYFWIDPKREESLTKIPEDKRHLMVRVWYPADPNDGALCHPYIVNLEEFGSSKERIADLTQVLTRSVWEAKVSARKGTYPLLLFSHGAGMTRFSSTAITEALAAEGYIVFSIDHTFFNNIKVFPDGYQAVRDVWPEDDKAGDSIEFATNHWNADTAFVLDKIEELNRTKGGRFDRRLDLGRIGIFGWSLGGMNAAQMCADDNRLKAGINYDGTMTGRVIRTGVERPFLLMKADRGMASIPGEEFARMVEQIAANESSFIRNSHGNIHVMTILKAEHTNFSDLVLMQPQREGRIDPRFCHEIIITYTLAFFDKYLLRKNSSLLDHVPDRYVSTITLTKK